MNYGYNPTTPYYSGYSYAPLQGPAAYSPTMLPPQQLPNIPQNVSTVAPGSNSNISWVQGREGALAYPVAPGNTVILMDSDNPVVYKKSADEHGKPLPMDEYELRKKNSSSNSSPTTSSTPSVDMSLYVKKSELETYVNERIRKELDKRVSNLSFKPATKKRRPEDEEEE